MSDRDRVAQITDAVRRGLNLADAKMVGELHEHCANLDRKAARVERLLADLDALLETEFFGTRVSTLNTARSALRHSAAELRGDASALRRELSEWQTHPPTHDP